MGERKTVLPKRAMFMFSYACIAMHVLSIEWARDSLHVITVYHALRPLFSSVVKAVFKQPTPCLCVWLKENPEK